MPALRPVSRRSLIQRFRDLGFDGPYAGTDHEFMVRGSVVVKVPNPHKSNEDIRLKLLKKVLDEAGVSRDEWLRGSRPRNGGGRATQDSEGGSRAKPEIHGPR